jgi:hypothetical protein
MLDVYITDQITGLLEPIGLQPENPGAGLLTIESVSKL